jgi:hypothetical protein
MRLRNNAQYIERCLFTYAQITSNEHSDGRVRGNIIENTHHRLWNEAQSFLPSSAAAVHKCPSYACSRLCRKPHWNLNITGLCLTSRSENPNYCQINSYQTMKSTCPSDSISIETFPMSAIVKHPMIPNSTDLVLTEAVPNLAQCHLVFLIAFQEVTTPFANTKPSGIWCLYAHASHCFHTQMLLPTLLKLRCERYARTEFIVSLM